MNYSKTEEKLMDAMAEMNIIDCHEHLPPEQDRTDGPQDVFTLFSHYTRYDLFSAGLDREPASATWPADVRELARSQYDALFDYRIPLDQRWKTFQPYWQRIRYGSYARAALLTAKMVYGIDDINDQTYQELSQRITAENTPGIYRRILCDRCRIAASMTQCGRTDVDRPLVPLMPGRMVTQLRRREQLDKLSVGLGVSISNLDDCIALGRKQLEKWADEGAIGIKIVSQYNKPPDRREAEDAFKSLLNGKELVPGPRMFEPLENFLLHHVIDAAADLDLVVAVHAGIWGDFRDLDCKDMLTLAPVHPRADFDLYHLGMPAVRDAIVISKNLPNVYLNLCWTHIISQSQACSGIDEMLDQVPINKVLAFGGDYSRPVEKVVGHLHMAREDLAQVFGRRIDRGLISFNEALEILRLWFWYNPLALYRRLKV